MKLNGTVIRKSESVTYKELGGEGVLYNSDNKDVHTLNKTALTVWRLCDTAENPGEIATVLAGHYGVPNDVVMTDVIACLDRFQALGLIRRSAR